LLDTQRPLGRFVAPYDRLRDRNGYRLRQPVECPVAEPVEAPGAYVHSQRLNVLSQRVNFLSLRVDVLSLRVNFLSLRVNFLSLRVNVLSLRVKTGALRDGHLILDDLEGQLR
jgi:hypothetical protein